MALFQEKIWEKFDFEFSRQEFSFEKCNENKDFWKNLIFQKQIN